MLKPHMISGGWRNREGDRDLSDGDEGHVGCGPLSPQASPEGTGTGTTREVRRRRLSRDRQ